MKYAIAELEIAHGDREFSSEFLIRSTKDLYQKAEKIASKFYGDEKGEKFGDSWDFFDVMVSVKGVTEVPKEDFKVLSKYLVTL